MSADILPQFRELDDQIAAEAFSEACNRIDEFDITFPDYGTTEFPPVPAWLGAISAAYLETDDSQEPARQNTGLTPADGYTMAETREALYEGYERLVSPLHFTRDLILSMDMPHKLNDLMIAAAEKAQAAKFRTIATFVVFQAAHEHQQFVGLMIPKKIITGLTLDQRQQALQLVGLLEQSDMEGKDEFTQVVRGTFQKLFHNDPSADALARVAAVLNLPDISRLRSTIDKSTEAEVKLEQAKSDGLSRQERRKQQHKARRQARKRQ